MDGAGLAYLLDRDYDIAVRAGAHCAPLMHEALGTTQTGAVRFSFSHFNTFTEVDTALAALKAMAPENGWLHYGKHPSTWKRRAGTC